MDIHLATEVLLVKHRLESVGAHQTALDNPVWGFL